MKNNTAVILLLLSVGLFYTFTNTQYQNVKSLYAIAGEYKNVLKSVEDIVELRDNLLSDYETIPRTEVDRINKVLPDNADAVRLALDLDTVASRHGISIKNIQTTTGAGEGGLAVLPGYGGIYEKATVTFTFVSDYGNFVDLLVDLERSLRIMNVKSISFQTNDSGLYDHQISVETYWLK